MNHFPVTSSLLSATHVAGFLSARYEGGLPTEYEGGLPTEYEGGLPAQHEENHHVSCQLIKSGINDTYLFTTGASKYVFRIYSLHWRTPVEIQEELRLLLHLKENDLPVSWPIADKQGHYIQTLHAPEGDRYAVLFSYAPGQKLQVYADEIHEQTGRVMARMHLLTQSLQLNRVTYSAQNLLIDSLVSIEKFLPANTPEMDFLKTAQQYLLKELAGVDLSALRQGVVHMDIWFDNMNIGADDNITLFDFDFCGNGWQCLDIAYYILQLHNVLRQMPECQPKIDHFLKGYTSVTPISAEEQRLIPALGVCMYFFYLGIQCERFHNWSNSFLNEAYLKGYINVLVKRYYELYKLGES